MQKIQKIALVIVAFIIFWVCIDVKAYIICNDGQESNSCNDCHQGCCSGHGGCLDNESETENYDYLKYIAIGAGAAGVAGAGYAGYKLGSKKSK